MADIDELKGYLRIDKTNLDDEVVHQPSLFYEISEAVVDAIAQRDALKEDLANIDADLDQETRKKVEREEKRITDTAVAKAIQRHPKHATAFSKYMAAKFKADQFLALKEAFVQRGYMLRDLCQIYVAGYYEKTSIQGSSATDTVVYTKRRQQMAEARANRK